MTGHRDRQPIPTAPARASGKEPTDQPGKLDEPQSPRRSEPKKKSDPENRPGQPPDAGNPPLAGENKKNQKSPQPDSGEEGSGEAAEQGKKGANKTGSGDKSEEPGDTDPSKQKTGRPGSKKVRVRRRSRPMTRASATLPPERNRERARHLRTRRESRAKKVTSPRGKSAGKRIGPVWIKVSGRQAR